MIVDAGDLDGDGFDDLAVAWGSVQTSLLVFLGGSTLSGEPTVEPNATVEDMPYSILLGRRPSIGRGDYDGDGYTDVVVGSSGNDTISARFLVLLGGQELSTSFDVTVDDAPCHTVTWTTPAGDLDGDGKDDFAIICSGADANNRRFGVLYGGTPEDGSLAEVWTTDIDLTSATRSMDMDNDGAWELLLGVSDATAVVWRLDDFDEVDPERYTLTTHVTAIDVGDHNGDARIDAVFDGAQTFDQTPALMRSASTTSFNAPPIPMTPPVDVDGQLSVCF